MWVADSGRACAALLQSDGTAIPACAGMPG